MRVLGGWVELGNKSLEVVRFGRRGGEVMEEFNYEVWAVKGVGVDGTFGGGCWRQKTAAVVLIVDSLKIGYTTELVLVARLLVLAVGVRFMATRRRRVTVVGG